MIVSTRGLAVAILSTLTQAERVLDLRLILIRPTSNPMDFDLGQQQVQGDDLFGVCTLGSMMTVEVLPPPSTTSTTSA